MTEEVFPDALPVGYRLHWYVIEHVLGQGGFGITHLAHDTNLDRRVAIKEYLPTDFARRRSDATVRPRTEASVERYAWGLERFLSEARTLARFDHPNIVRVVSVFEANNTAYMVMRFEDGENLATLLERSGTLPERKLLDCLLPILDGLQLVHEAGFIHRDIKPENIYVRRDGSPVLLDFGSARQSFGRSKTMTILVAPGYAPLEQYYGDAATQGPWTDIYGLGATCYRAIAGQAPLDAVARAKGVLGSAREILAPALDLGRGRYSERLLAAIDWAMQLSERDRPQSLADWRRELAAPAASAPPVRAAPAPAAPVPVVPQAPVPVAMPAPPGAGAAPGPRKPLLWGALATAGVLTAGAALVMVGRVSAPPAEPAAPQAALLVPSAAPPAPPAAPATPAPPPPAPEAPRIPEPATPPVPAATPSPTIARTSPPLSTIAVAAPVVARTAARREAPERAQPAARSTPVPAAAPETAPATASAVPAVALLAPVAPAPPAEVARPATPSAAQDGSARRQARDEQLDAAEAALKRGDHAAAAELLAPWAAAGVPHAQALLGRARESNRGRQQSDFEAYVWYSMAARGGEPGAQAMKDKVAGRLQPAEIRQADQVVERWKPRAEPAAGTSR